MPLLKKILRISILVFLFCTLIFQISAESLILTDNNQEVSMGKYLEILEDEKGSLTIDDITSPAYANVLHLEEGGNIKDTLNELSKKGRPAFVKNRTETLNFGFSQSVYWIRFKLDSRDRERTWILETGYPSLDYINLYFPADNGRYRTAISGDRFHFSHREINYRNVAFRIPSNYDHEKYIYLRVQTSGTLQIPLRIISSANFTDMLADE